VICGHIHSPAIRKIGSIDYYNSGDWVESCSALLEDFEGKITLVTNLHAPLNEPDVGEENAETAAPSALLHKAGK
jgi:hypothetical protein